MITSYVYNTMALLFAYKLVQFIPLCAYVIVMEPNIQCECECECQFYQFNCQYIELRTHIVPHIVINMQNEQN